jgi:hypothetical protein
MTTREEESRWHNYHGVITLVFYLTIIFGNTFRVPNSSSDHITSLTAIHETCDNFSVPRLCDPQGIIENEQYQDTISQSIRALKSDYNERYASTLSVAVIVLDEVEVGAKVASDNFYERCNYITKTLMESWEVDQGEEAVILFSRAESMMCLSCTDVLKSILTDQRIDDISQQLGVKWSDEAITMLEITRSIDRISWYINDGPPSFLEKYAEYGLFLFVIGFIIFHFVRYPNVFQTEGLGYHPTSRFQTIQDVTLRQLQSLKEMDAQEHEKAEMLMNRYECYSCIICLEVYNKEECGGNINEIEEGSDYGSLKEKNFVGVDQEPIQLLRCGHSTCRSCWTMWAQQGKSSSLCPLCKIDIGG